jgi:hypothetical protein
LYFKSCTSIDNMNRSDVGITHRVPTNGISGMAQQEAHMMITKNMNSKEGLCNIPECEARNK